MAAQPVISIVGRANVGKSTLYNRLTRSRDAIVDDLSGVTRDRLVGKGALGGRSFWVVDTGGYENGGASELESAIRKQFDLAVEGSDAVILVVDGREGPAAGDTEIADRLRRAEVPVYVAVNKSEGRERELATAEFYRLGIGTALYAISATHGSGVGEMMEDILDAILSDRAPQGNSVEVDCPRVAVLGKPNAGKSTLVNKLIGEDRMIVSDAAGTTRDSVGTRLTFGGRDYTLLDTAGIRRKSRISEKLERISIVKALHTMEHAHVIILVVDARLGITDQDARLAGLVQQAGRGMVLVINKWDGLEAHQKTLVRRSMARGLPFLDHVPVLFVSAKYGSGLDRVMPAVQRVYDSAMADLGTAKLNDILRRAAESQPPPRVGRRQIKLKYAHQGGKNPPTVVIHGTLLDKMPESYKRYLANRIGRELGLTGTRVNLWFRTTQNPFAGARS
jgi:GTP-binding protein